MGQKPDDWRTVPCCHDCHTEQHSAGEPTFWRTYYERTGQTVEELIVELSKASPKAADIRRIQRERAA